MNKACESSPLQACLGSSGQPTAALRPATAIVNAMTVDVEDYFQVSAFAPHVRRDEWDRYPHRVERNTDAVLQLFSDHDVRGTFFTLGWVAERCPRLIRRISEAGHELASHGMAHVRVDAQSPEAFGSDVERSRKLLEDVSGRPVIGYRAASFSIGEKTPWAFEILAERGYSYSSSVYPIRHDHYGMPSAPRFPFRPVPSSDFVEVPVATVKIQGRSLPCGGGGYFRLLPYAAMRWALRKVNAEERRPCVFYFHPWEIDPEQPRLSGLSFKTRFRHYTNLRRMAPKLGAILADFRWDRLDQAIPLSEVSSA